MKKTAYIKPLIEVVEVDGNALMEVWSIGIDNDPGHSINPVMKRTLVPKKVPLNTKTGENRISILKRTNNYIQPCPNPRKTVGHVAFNITKK